MEPQDILADHVHEFARRVIAPVLLESCVAMLAACVTDTRHISGEGVVPDVKDLLGIVRPGNAPLDAFAADGNVVQAAPDEALDLVHAEIRLHEFRILLVVLEQSVLESGKLKEVIVLADQFRRTAAVRAIDGIAAFGNIHLIEDAVASFIATLLDDTRLVLSREAQHALHRGDMVGLIRVNEIIVSDAELFPELDEELALLSDKFARRHSSRRRGAFKLLAVLIGAGEKRD